MANATHIPKAVKKVYSYLSDIKGEPVRMGTWKGKDLYGFRFDEEVELGYPIFVVVDKNGNATEISGREAHDIVASLPE